MPTPQKIYAGADLIYESPVTDLPQQVASSSAVTVLADASANTKGAWTELIASNDAQSDWMFITCHFATVSATDTSFLVDIGTGTSGNEVVRIANVGLGQRANPGDNTRNPAQLLVPIRVASNTRIAARAQSNSGGRQGTIRVQTLKGAARSSMPTTLDTIGADTAASRGTNMPTSNAYVQLTASTSQRYQALVATATGPNAVYAAEASTYTIATGASGSESVLFTFDVQTTTSESIRAPGPGEFTTTYIGDIPAGTRIAARQSVGRTYRDVIVYGVPYA